jgi:hypothetical protein
METTVRTEVKVEDIQEGVGTIRHDVGAMTQNVVDNNVITARTETKVESLQRGVGAIKQNMVDEKVSRQ